MKEYLDKEVVQEMLENAQIISNGEYYGYCTEDVRLNSIPTADVAEVKHGRWIEYPRAHYFKCSECKYTVPYRKAVLVNGSREYNYCPNCGALMKEDEHEAD
jgi:hypothetical protein